MKDFAIRVLASANRRAKRWLGVADRYAWVPPPAMSVPAVKPAVHAPASRPRSLVFALAHASRGAGGLADVLHLGAALEETCGLSVSYLNVGGMTHAATRENIRWTRPSVRDEQVLGELAFVPEYYCATAWPTVYDVVPSPSQRKLYFVQDYEPWFHKAGVDRHYAMATYGMGLEMFTLGPWLAEHVMARHGIRNVLAMPFPVTDAGEPGDPPSRRDTVALYVQPDKEHRGTPLMLEASRRIGRNLAGRKPAMRLVVFGSDDNPHLKLDFPCDVCGVLPERELLALFRRTRVGVSASSSNVSLMPFRMMAHGCFAVDLDLPNVSGNVPACARPLARLSAPDAAGIADAVERLLNNEPGESVRRRAVEDLCSAHSWRACANAIRGLFAEPARSNT